jgi:hypothetical protein
MLTANYLEPSLKAFGSVLMHLKKGEILPDKLLAKTLHFFSWGITNADAYRLLKPDVDNLIKEFMFPLCCFTAKDELLWNENPQKYIEEAESSLSKCLKF